MSTTPSLDLFATYANKPTGPLGLRLLFQTLLCYETGVHGITLKRNTVLQKDLYEALAALGQTTVIVHPNDLRMDQHRRWSVIYCHKHMHHICGQPGWDWDTSYNDDLSDLIAAKVVVNIDCDTPAWLSTVSQKPQGTRRHCLRINFV